jgi:hypothetical protein
VPTQRTPGASVKVVAVGTSELVASSKRPFLVTNDLKPGRFHEGASGRVRLTNTMEQPLAVRIHAVPSIPDLNHLLRVRLAAGSELLFRGALGGLHSWTTRQLVIPTHTRRQLQASVLLPASVKRGYQNRAVEVSLEFKLAPAETVKVAPASGRH